MNEILSGVDLERVFATLSLIAQTASVLVVVWMLIRVERRLDEAQATVENQAGRCNAALTSVQQSHQGLHAAAHELSDATRAWTAAPTPATAEQASEIIRIVANLGSQPAPLPSHQPAKLPAPSADSIPKHERQLRVQLEAEAAELRRKLQDRTLQLSEMQRDRRQFAQDAARASALETINRQLQSDISAARNDARTAHSSLQSVVLELKASRAQIQRLSGAQPPGAPSHSRSDTEVAAYVDRIDELQRLHHDLQDAYESLKMEHARTLQEKAFIESHYLDLAEA